MYPTRKAFFCVGFELYFRLSHQEALGLSMPELSSRAKLHIFCPNLGGSWSMVFITAHSARN